MPMAIFACPLEPMVSEVGLRAAALLDAEARLVPLERYALLRGRLDDARDISRHALARKRRC